MNSVYPAGTCATPQEDTNITSLPPVPTPPNLYHPALALLEGATLSCWVLGWVCWAGRAPLPSKGCQTALLFSLRSPSPNFTPLSSSHSISLPHHQLRHQRRFTRPSPSRHILHPGRIIPQPLQNLFGHCSHLIPSTTWSIP